MNKSAGADFKIHPLLAQRWSPRAFSERPVAKEEVHSLLEAARWAASSFNEQPWAFLVATKEDSEAHDIMARCLVDQNRQWAAQAPVLMITLARNSFLKNDKPNRHAWHDLGLAVGNLSVEAMSRNLWLHQMAGIKRELITETFGINDPWEPVTAIAIGYLGEADQLPEKLAERESAPRVRRSQAEFTHFNPKGPVHLR